MHHREDHLQPPEDSAEEPQIAILDETEPYTPPSTQGDGFQTREYFPWLRRFPGLATPPLPGEQTAKKDGDEAGAKPSDQASEQHGEQASEQHGDQAADSSAEPTAQAADDSAAQAADDPAAQDSNRPAPPPDEDAAPAPAPAPAPTDLNPTDLDPADLDPADLEATNPSWRAALSQAAHTEVPAEATPLRDAHEQVQAYWAAPNPKLLVTAMFAVATLFIFALAATMILVTPQLLKAPKSTVSATPLAAVTPTPSASATPTSKTELIALEGANYLTNSTLELEEQRATYLGVSTKGLADLRFPEGAVEAGKRVEWNGIQAFARDIRDKDYAEISKFCWTRTPEVITDRYFTDPARAAILEAFGQVPEAGAEGVYWPGNQVVVFAPWVELKDNFTCPYVRVNNRVDVPTGADVTFLIDRLLSRHSGSADRWDLESSYPLTCRNWQTPAKLLQGVPAAQALRIDTLNTDLSAEQLPLLQYLRGQLLELWISPDTKLDELQQALPSTKQSTAPTTTPATGEATDSQSPAPSNGTANTDNLAAGGAENGQDAQAQGDAHPEGVAAADPPRGFYLRAGATSTSTPAALLYFNGVDQLCLGALLPAQE